MLHLFHLTTTPPSILIISMGSNLVWITSTLLPDFVGRAHQGEGPGKSGVLLRRWDGRGAAVSPSYVSCITVAWWYSAGWGPWGQMKEMLARANHHVRRPCQATVLPTCASPSWPAPRSTIAGWSCKKRARTSSKAAGQVHGVQNEGLWPLYQRSGLWRRCNPPPPAGLAPATLTLHLWGQSERKRHGSPARMTTRHSLNLDAGVPTQDAAHSSPAGHGPGKKLGGRQKDIVGALRLRKESKADGIGKRRCRPTHGGWRGPARNLCV